MKSARQIVGILLIVLLTLGYAASQWMTLQGRAAEWAAKVDVPPIRMLALVLLVGALALAFVPDREAT